jgi:heparosan-N-sulfate-glucuronate 5-epimerase
MSGFWRSLPVIRLLVAEWRLWRTEQTTPCFRLADVDAAPAGLPAYPLDLAPLLALPFGSLDEQGVPFNAPIGSYPAAYHPTTIAQYALAHWNAYLASGDEANREGFMTQARWLVAHETALGEGMGGWPMPFPIDDYATPQRWLSALTQGNGISVLVRAYRLTGEQIFLDVARRAVRMFEVDVLDGGVSVPVGKDGLFFEEVAVYPAAHILNGAILAIFGLYDYVALTDESEIARLIERSLATLHSLLDQYDTGYWTYYDLLHYRLVPRFYHSLHVTLLEALARLSNCQHCTALAARWNGYQRRWPTRLRALLVSRGARYRRALWRRVRRRFFPAPPAQAGAPDAVCVPITAFPVAGGMRGVLAGVAQVMAEDWQLTYLTGIKGSDTEGLTIHAFGRAWAMYWQFPNVWLYVLAGWQALISLLRSGPGFRLILPQDGLYSGAFAALAGRLAGVRVVCMDHGSVTLPFSRAYHAERLKLSAAQPWLSRLLTRLRFWWYWPSLKLLARFAARHTDHFLVAGDEVETIYLRQLGIPPSRITRYPYIIDASRYAPPPAEERARRRAQHGIAVDACVITMINRLAVEKGMDVALAGITQALEKLSDEQRAQVQIILAGDGPLRAQIEGWLVSAGLDGCCTLWGEATPADVMRLLSISDIFLYTGTRGTNYSMAVLEAMAAGCAVIASTQPQSMIKLLAEGRGLAIPAGDAAAVSEALLRVITDRESCQQMGQLARAYVIEQHSAAALRRCLRQATFWQGFFAGS